MSTKSNRRYFLSSLFTSTTLIASGCGTFLYPERRGQPRTGGLNWRVVTLNSLATVLFIVPGLICFAVDWMNGTLYLPPNSHSGNPNTENELVKIQLDPNHMEREDIEEAILKQTGKVISLEPGTFETQELESISVFDQAVAKACQKRGFSSEMILRCQSPVL